MIAISRTRADVLAELGRAISTVLSNQDTVTADDVRRIVTIPSTIDPRIVGVAFREAARDGLIERVGSIATSRPAGGAHLMYVWKRAKPVAGDRAKEGA